MNSAPSSIKDKEARLRTILQELASYYPEDIVFCGTQVAGAGEPTYHIGLFHARRILGTSPKSLTDAILKLESKRRANAIHTSIGKSRIV